MSRIAHSPHFAPWSLGPPQKKPKHAPCYVCVSNLLCPLYPLYRTHTMRANVLVAYGHQEMRIAFI